MEKVYNNDLKKIYNNTKVNNKKIYNKSKKIYIVTTYTGTALSYLIRNLSDNQYSHVSLSLNEELSPMYSFGRLKPTNPIFAGFVEEQINQGLYAIKNDTICRVYSTEIDNYEYRTLVRNLDRMMDN
ncbi:MAG: hypothetical protein LBR30_06715, partial [Clostridioides sp.]|nr:hypothetical protein [Clostridioides sp.]